MLGTVLVVDDDGNVRDTSKLVLEREGYGVLAAPDGKTAIELMSQRDRAAKVCALLCDLEMPNINGKELINHFRMHFPSIPIIVLSGASDEVYLEGIAQEGVCDWLRKPFTRELLLQKVRTAAHVFSLRQSGR